MENFSISAHWVTTALTERFGAVHVFGQPRSAERSGRSDAHHQLHLGARDYFFALGLAALTFAQRFFGPAIIRAFASGLIFRFFFGAAGAGAATGPAPDLAFNFDKRA